MSENRGETGRFKPGHSGNPGGRPKAWIEFRDAMRNRTEAALAEIDRALASEDADHRRWAATTVLSYAWGRPPQAMTGEGGEGPLDIVTEKASLSPAAEALLQQALGALANRKKAAE